MTTTDDWLSTQTLDYLFEVQDLRGFPGERYHIVEDSVVVEKFKTEGKKFTQLSDHYALEACIAYGGMNPIDELPEFVRGENEARTKDSGPEEPGIAAKMATAPAERIQDSSGARPNLETPA